MQVVNKREGSRIAVVSVDHSLVYVEDRVQSRRAVVSQPRDAQLKVVCSLDVVDAANVDVLTGGAIELVGKCR